MDKLYQEKISHLNELIKLSRVDGLESPNEVSFINSVAEKMGIGIEDLEKIRKSNDNIVFTLPDDMLQLMMQFHRITILMGIDRIIAESELDFCYDLGIKMKLKPEAIREILELAVHTPRHIISVDDVEMIFYKYYSK